jgi:transposase
MYYCGIDIAKRKHEVSVIDEAGRLLSKSFPIDNSADGAAVLFGFFSENGIDKTDVLIGMEATGHYWLSLYSYLTEAGCDVKVINPITSDAFRKMYIRQTKKSATTTSSGGLTTALARALLLARLKGGYFLPVPFFAPVSELK